MFEKSELQQFDPKFPHDTQGRVPVHGDCWRNMRFDHAELNPEEPGISAEERKRRTEYLDTQWWPKVLESVHKEHQRLKDEHGELFIQHWDRLANNPPEQPHGFRAV